MLRETGTAATSGTDFDLARGNATVRFRTIELPKLVKATRYFERSEGGMNGSTGVTHATSRVAITSAR